MATTIDYKWILEGRGGRAGRPGWFAWFQNGQPPPPPPKPKNLTQQRDEMCVTVERRPNLTRGNEKKKNQSRKTFTSFVFPFATPAAEPSHSRRPYCP